MQKAYVVAAAVLGMMSAGAVAQTRPAPGTGFSAQELERMSQQNLQEGAHRGFGAGAKPSGTIAAAPLHQPAGLWVCKSTEPFTKILSAPRAGARPIGQSPGQVAAGADTGAFTSVLFHESRVGYLPTSEVHPYHNAFNPRASCRFAGLRPNGMVTFDIR